MKVVIAAGGTAGHVVPALAVADALRAEGHDPLFVGTRERAEAELVPAAGYEIRFIRVEGLDRSNPLRAARAAWRAAAAVPASRRLLKELSPAVVIGAGGYVAGPVGLAAALMRLPLLLTESDSHLGISNRLLARFAGRVCLAFPIAGLQRPPYLVTGRPVPAVVVDADGAAGRRRFDLDGSGRVVLIFGGSQGARSVNRAAIEALIEPLPDGALVLHVSGRRDHAEIAARLEAAGSPSHYRLEPYLSSADFGLALAASDLVVARAGGSVFELAAAGRPALLVPYPHATADHQAQNAAWMADAGAAVVLPDSQLDAARLRAEVLALLADDARLTAMAAASRALARPDAARLIAREAVALAAP